MISFATFKNSWSSGAEVSIGGQFPRPSSRPSIWPSAKSFGLRWPPFKFVWPPFDSVWPPLTSVWPPFGLHYNLCLASTGLGLVSNCLSLTSIGLHRPQFSLSWPQMIVLSGVPQGSVLWSRFILFINDIDYGILSNIYKFTDETKPCKAVGDDHEASILREDLCRMFRSSQD